MRAGRRSWNGRANWLCIVGLLQVEMCPGMPLNTLTASAPCFLGRAALWKTKRISTLSWCNSLHSTKNHTVPLGLCPVRHGHKHNLQAIPVMGVQFACIKGTTTGTGWVLTG